MTTTDIEAPEDVAVGTALDELRQVLIDDIDRTRLLLASVKDLQQRRRHGAGWAVALADQGPENMVRMCNTASRRRIMAQAKATEALLLAMRAGGSTTITIAALYGVTHQRVQNVLYRVRRREA